jgi:hypothetical protein
MKINSIQLVKQPGTITCWDLYVNDQYIGIYVTDSQEFVLKHTQLGVLIECQVSIAGSVYPKIGEDGFREAISVVAATGNTTLTET